MSKQKLSSRQDLPSDAGVLRNGVNRGAQCAFVGLDLSLRETGVAIVGRDFIGLQLKAISSPKDKSNFERMIHIRNTILRHIRSRCCKNVIVAIEGYAVGAKFQLANMAELGGIVRAGLYDAGIPYMEVPPSNLKKYATGKGAGDKIAVVMGVLSKWKVRITNHNLCDAYVLAKMAEGWGTQRKLLQYEKEAMQKVQLHSPVAK